ncbi:MAG: hypothetical protein ACQET5_13285 [Halobacteriota archaeon]|uniref:hypothetical protein n=1 Tax=Natronomonas sp. TaxID=2184060 RepID=UPI003974CF1B
MITLGVSAGGVIAPFVFGYAIETVSAGTAFVATAAVDSLTRLLARGRTGAIVVVGMETQKRTDRIRGV